MLKCSSGKVGSGQWAVGSEDTLARARSFRVRCHALVRGLLPAAHCPRRTVFVLLLTAHCTLLTGACRVDMQDQPKMKPYRSSTFFRDGLSARPPIEGTVARGFLKTDTEFFTGKKAGRTAATASTSAAAATAPGELRRARQQLPRREPVRRCKARRLIPTTSKFSRLP